MGMTSPAAHDAAGAASRRLSLVLFGALAAAVAAEIALAVTFGGAPRDARDAWGTVLAIFLALSLAGAGVLLAVWRARHLAVSGSMGLAIAGAGLLMRMPFFGSGVMLEDDHFRYLLDGAMLAEGLSPYAHAPAAVLNGVPGVPPALVDAGRAMIVAINFPELRSIYPGSAQLMFALAHWIKPWSIDGLRLVIFAAEALTAVLVWRLLVLTGRSPLLTALYWCNPLLAFCLTGQAHIDAVLVPPLLLALIAVQRNAGAGAGVGLGLAVGVKLWPVLLAPLVMRALWPDRRALARFVPALGLVTLALCGPLLWASRTPDAGLTAYAGGWSINNAPYAWISYTFYRLIGPGTGEVILRALVMLAAASASLAVTLRPIGGLPDLLARATLLAALVFYLSPAQFPWYSVWFLPLAAASGSWRLAAASVGLPIYYLFFPLALAGQGDIHGYGLAFLHLLPLLLMTQWVRGASHSGATA